MKKSKSYLFRANQSLVLFFLSIMSSLIFAQNMQFSADSIITTGYQPYELVCSDFNGDDAVDIAVAIQNELNSDPVAIFLNDGNGKIMTVPDSLYQNSDAPRGLSAGDLNNDQITDLAVSVYDDSTVSILLGNGDGTFTKNNVLHTPTKPEALLIADLDQDMNNDLAVVSRYSFLMIFYGDGTGHFSEPVVKSGIGSANDVKACDMNRDGYLDLLIGTGNVHGVVMLTNDGSGNFTTQNNLPTYRPSWFIETADFNHDSYIDIAAGSGSWDFDNIYLLLGDSEGNFTCPDTLSPGTYVADISVADYNNDKNPDVMSADRNGLYILTGSGDGFFSNIDTLVYDPSDYQAKAIQSADINGDGRTDLIVARETQISIYYNIGPFTSISKEKPMLSSFELFQNYPNPFNPSTIIAFQIPESDLVKLVVFNALGQRVQTLVNEERSAGKHLIYFDASDLCSGTYFYQLTVGNFLQRRKMVYLH